jgi:FkbM family methyltransferase
MMLSDGTSRIRRRGDDLQGESKYSPQRYRLSASFAFPPRMLALFYVFCTFLVWISKKVEARSQFKQDEWVLSMTRTRFFLDVGANDGEVDSNTFELEKAGWNGICIDARPRNHEFRKAKYIAAALSSSERNVSFLHKEVVHGHSGIQEMLLDAHKEQSRMDHVEVMRTRILADILDEHSAPKFIDYFSLDTEGAEYDILSSFPFYRYKFGLITVEHNFQEPKRSMIRRLLDHHGYRFDKEVDVDDWFVNKHMWP